MGPAARSRTRATVRSARPRCPRSRGRISLSTSPSIGDLISSVRSLVGTKKLTPCRVHAVRAVRAIRAVRAVRAASRKGDSKPRPPRVQRGIQRLERTYFGPHQPFPYINALPLWAHDTPTNFAGDSTIHRHASTRYPAEEAGTIVCPETPALRAERGDSLMLCEAQPALIVIFKKS